MPFMPCCCIFLLFLSLPSGNREMMPSLVDVILHHCCNDKPAMPVGDAFPASPPMCAPKGELGAVGSSPPPGPNGNLDHKAETLDSVRMRLSAPPPPLLPADNNESLTSCCCRAL